MPSLSKQPPLSRLLPYQAIVFIAVLLPKMMPSHWSNNQLHHQKEWIVTTTNGNYKAATCRATAVISPDTKNATPTHRTGHKKEAYATSKDETPSPTLPYNAPPHTPSLRNLTHTKCADPSSPCCFNQQTHAPDRDQPRSQAAHWMRCHNRTHTKSTQPNTHQMRRSHVVPAITSCQPKKSQSV